MIRSMTVPVMPGTAGLNEEPAAPGMSETLMLRVERGDGRIPGNDRAWRGRRSSTLR